MKLAESTSLGLLFWSLLCFWRFKIQLLHLKYCISTSEFPICDNITAVYTHGCMPHDLQAATRPAGSHMTCLCSLDTRGSLLFHTCTIYSFCLQCSLPGICRAGSSLLVRAQLRWPHLREVLPDHPVWSSPSSVILYRITLFMYLHIYTTLFISKNHDLKSSSLVVYLLIVCISPPDYKLFESRD